MRRAEAFYSSIRPEHDELLRCVYPRMIRRHERRAGCGTHLVPKVHARVDRQLAVV